MLGVCFGHQIIGKALGGQVGFNPNGDEYGLFAITTISNNMVFGKTLAKQFWAFATHSQSILKLPEGAISHANSDLEPNHIVHFGNKSWGFQLHPEFTYELTNAYICAMKNAESLGTKNQQNDAELFGQELLDLFFDYCD